MADPRVVYIAGVQNCGSTLLDALLGQAPGARSLGEVGGFHRYATTTARCDCGEPPAGCGLCQAVIAATDADGRLSELLPAALKERRVHWLLLPTKRRRAYARVSNDLFRAVAARTGSSVLVDSSKNVSRAAALAFDGELDVRLVHVVRDGRGFLDSRRRRAETDGRRFVPPAEMAKWLFKNALLSAVLRPRLGPERYLLCRYEDLVRDPVAQLARIGAFCDLDLSAVARAALERGVPRDHLFEPARRVDYGLVRLEPDRLDSQRRPPRANARYWVLGGFVSALWGYHRDQRHLDRHGPSGPR